MNKLSHGLNEGRKRLSCTWPFRHEALNDWPDAAGIDSLSALLRSAFVFLNDSKALQKVL